MLKPLAQRCGSSCARTAHELSSPESVTAALHSETKVFDVLPDETWVYPGHGKDTSIGAERPHLPEWRARGW